MNYNEIRFEVRKNVAYVTLDRPAALNAVNLEVNEELARAALECQYDRRIRSVLFRATGEHFCAGGDLERFAQEGDRVSEYVTKAADAFHLAISRFTRLDAPVVGAVQGLAIGGGMSIVAMLDIPIAGEGARFMCGYTRIGLTPDGALTYFLPRLVGRRRALDLILTNRTLNAREALEIGLIARVVPDTNLQTEAEECANALAEGPTRSFGAAKRLLLQSSVESLDTQMAYEGRELALAVARPDGKEGAKTFKERRRSRFSGE